MKLLSILSLSIFLVLSGCKNDPTEERKPIAANDTKGLEALIKAELKKDVVDDTLHLGFKFGMSLSDVKQHIAELKLNGEQINIDQEDPRYILTDYTPLSLSLSQPLHLYFGLGNDSLMGFYVGSMVTDSSKYENENQKKDRGTFVNHYLQHCKSIYGTPSFIQTDYHVNNPEAFEELIGTAYYWFNGRKMVKLVDVPLNYNLYYNYTPDTLISSAMMNELAQTVSNRIDTAVWGISLPADSNSWNILKEDFKTNGIETYHFLYKSYNTFYAYNVGPYDTICYRPIGARLRIIATVVPNSNPSQILEANQTVLQELKAVHGEPYLHRAKADSEHYMWIYKNYVVYYGYSDTDYYLEYSAPD